MLIAAVAHAVWNTAAKYKRGDSVLFVWAYTVLSTLLCLPFGVMAVLNGSQPVNWQLVLGSVVSGVLHMVYSLTLQNGYDRFELGVVYPVARGTGPVLTMLVAVLLLGERPGWVALLGALIVVAGIVVVAGNPFRARIPAPAAKVSDTGQRRPLRGVLWGAATGATIAAYTLWDSHSVTSLHLEPITYFTGSYLLQCLFLTPRALRQRNAIPPAVRSNLTPILVVAVFSPLAYILVLTAMQTSPVALVAPLRESSIVIGALLAWWIFREGHLARRITGAVIVLAGIAAISV